MTQDSSANRPVLPLGDRDGTTVGNYFVANYPPFSWPGGSMIVDYDGRILSQADAGPGTKIVVAPVDITALRHDRAARSGHHMLAHLRSEAYPVYRRSYYPPGQWSDADPEYETNVRKIDEAKGGL